MINLVVKKKARVPKPRIIQLRLAEDLFKKIKASLPKDKSVSTHALLVSILETTFANGSVKVKVLEASDDKQRGDDSEMD